MRKMILLASSVVVFSLSKVHAGVISVKDSTENKTEAMLSGKLLKLNSFFTISSASFNFNGVDFVTDRGNIVMINNIVLTDSISTIVNSKIKLLDRAQLYYAEQYNVSALVLVDNWRAKMMHKRMLKILNTTTTAIAKLVVKPEQLTVQNFEKIRKPNLNIDFNLPQKTEVLAINGY